MPAGPRAASGRAEQTLDTKAGWVVAKGPAGLRAVPL